ncbi:MAG TPA: DJ-1/PfpI family protein [Candidatus Binatia bacterium]|nr:DJ-1/PfpI family protein [Candidatus Binatia bacterium]
MHISDARLQQVLATRGIEVGILIFPDVEELDFTGPLEVFSVAARMARTHRHPPFRVSTIAADTAAVPARHGLTVIPRARFAEHPAPDLLVIPGGVMDQPLGDRRTLDWVRAAAESAALTASVCTGAFVLAELGLLDGLSATTHWEDIADLRRQYPQVNVLEDVPYVDEGAIVTSAGISAGIGMSLHLVGRVLGHDAALRTARQMQYDWTAAERAAA